MFKQSAEAHAGIGGFYPALSDTELRAARISRGELPMAKMGLHFLQNAMDDTSSQRIVFRLGSTLGSMVCVT